MEIDMHTEITREESRDTPTAFELEIEGKSVTWSGPIITTEEIARLGGWDPAQGVIMVDRENNERTLGADEKIEIKPGIGFGKRIRWKRG
jgi:hypothetical protein